MEDHYGVEHALRPVKQDDLNDNAIVLETLGHSQRLVLLWVAPMDKGHHDSFL
jgi:hypothetical protein